jgi:hypothetical protein
MLADKLVSTALEGDVPALRELGNRLDGMPVQAVEVGQPGDFETLTDAELRKHIARELGISRANGAGIVEAEGSESVQ